MKKTFITLLIALIFSAMDSFAQAPQAFSYQSVIRDGAGELVANQQVGIQISILQGSATGTAVYTETHSPTTNANGLASLNIGEGTPSTGVFASINWANGPYFVETSTDPAGGTNYSISSVSQLLSVPYANYSAVADSVSGSHPIISEGKTRIIYGEVEADGSSPNAQGFSSSRIPIGAPGYSGPWYRYQIEFNSSFSETPECIITNIYTEGVGGNNSSPFIGNVFNIVETESDQDTITILVYNPTINFATAKFSFFAIGQTE